MKRHWRTKCYDPYFAVWERGVEVDCCGRTRISSSDGRRGLCLLETSLQRCGKSASIENSASQAPTGMSFVSEMEEGMSFFMVHFLAQKAQGSGMALVF